MASHSRESINQVICDRAKPADLVWRCVVVRDDLLESHQHRHSPRRCPCHLSAGVLAAESDDRRVDVSLSATMTQRGTMRLLSGIGQWDTMTLVSETSIHVVYMCNTSIYDRYEYKSGSVCNENFQEIDYVGHRKQNQRTHRYQDDRTYQCTPSPGDEYYTRGGYSWHT